MLAILPFLALLPEAVAPDPLEGAVRALRRDMASLRRELDLARAERLRLQRSVAELMEAA